MSTESNLAEIRSARTYVPVTPSDTVDLPDGIARALLVGTPGAATLQDRNGVVRTGVPLQAGYNPIDVKRVYLTALGAANIWALY